MTTENMPLLPQAGCPLRSSAQLASRSVEAPGESRPQLSRRRRLAESTTSPRSRAQPQATLLPPPGWCGAVHPPPTRCRGLSRSESKLRKWDQWPDVGKFRKLRRRPLQVGSNKDPLAAATRQARHRPLKPELHRLPGSAPPPYPSVASFSGIAATIERWGESS